MSQVGALTLTATTSTELRARGEEKQLKAWLAEGRPELSPDNRRQICHHARKLLDLVGCLVPATIADGPETVEAWISALDLPAVGLDPRRRSHLARAARTLYAAANDLPPAQARTAMDRQRPRPNGGPPADTLLPDRPYHTTPVATDAAPPADKDPAQIAVYVERGDGTRAPLTTRPLPDADMPPAFLSLEKAIANHAALDRATGAAGGDVRATTRRVLAFHSPAARMGLLSRLPGIEAVRVTADGGRETSPLAVCDAIVLAYVEARARAQPVQAAAAA
mgnify:CR=1 FL=1